MKQNHAYLNYWRRKELLSGQVPAFPVLRKWSGGQIAESDRVCFEAVRTQPSLLDFGAGDLKHMHMFRDMGYTGEYLTLDIGHEYAYDYRDISEVDRTFGAILFMDVLEHMPLDAGLEIVVQLTERLRPGGVLVIQTPNARCVRHPLSSDMTHIHCYNIHDLWAYLSALDLKVQGYRVKFTRERLGLPARLREFLSALLITQVLGSDYADNVLLIAQKPDAESAEEDSNGERSAIGSGLSVADDAD